MNGPQDTPYTDWVPPERAAQLVLRLASGEADRISGRHISVRDSLDELLERLDEIERDDLLKLRFRVMARSPAQALTPSVSSPGSAAD